MLEAGKLANYEEVIHTGLYSSLRIVGRIELALQHPEIGEAFRAYLKEFCKTL